MMDIGKSAATGIQATLGVKAMIAKASQDICALKISIQSLTLVGKLLPANGRHWEEVFNSLQDETEDKEAAYFALWRRRRDCILISYTPDDIKPKEKMLYSGTRSAVKDAIIEVDDGCTLVEYNITTVSELNSAAFTKEKSAPKAYTEQELLRQEHDDAVRAGNTGGGYGFLAQMMKAQKEEENKKQAPVALPGLADLKKGLPKRLSHVVPETSQATDDEVAKEIEELQQKPIQTPVALPGMALPGLVKKPVEAEPEVATEEEADAEPEVEIAVETEVEEATVEVDNNDVAKSEEKVETEKVALKKAEEPVPAKPLKKEPVRKTNRSKGSQKKGGFLGFVRKKSKNVAKDEPTEEQLAQYSDEDGESYDVVLEAKRTKAYGDRNPSALESYLSSREFFRVFKMDKSAYASLPAWKRKRLKKAVNLF